MEKQRAELRHQLRSRRRALSLQEQQAAAEALLTVIRKEQIIGDSRHVALYLANDGEIDPDVLVQWLWKQGVQCYLPTLYPEKKRELLFVAYDLKTKLSPNRFGINEPVFEQGKVIDASELDLVFLPLTGFSEDGQRMGMGGGFYDSTFAFAQSTTKPRLIGLAHECQKVEDTFSLEWDVPMDGIVTNHQFYKN